MAETIFQSNDYIIPCNHIRQYARSTSSSQEDILHLAVKQYRPRYDIQDGDVTILACHASGMPKELYEPIWEAMFQRAEQRPAGSRIRAVWIADVANQGQSGVLNATKLGNDPSWFDHARDYLALVNHFRTEMIRPIVGFGHSMGGNVIINLALLHPRLLTSVVTIEPILNKTPGEMNFMSVLPLTLKVDKWPSKDIAMASITKSPFYASWDQRVLGLFRKHGLRALSKIGDDGPVTLVTTKDQEVFSFARAAYPSSTLSLDSFVLSRVTHPDMGPNRSPTHPFYRPEATVIYQQLPFLRPSCLFIYGDRSHMNGSKPQGRKDKLSITGTAVGGSGGAEAGLVQDVVLKGSHFVPFESPEAITALLMDWFDREVGSWAKREAEESLAWHQIPYDQRSLVDSEWIHWAKKLTELNRKARARL